jgi:hypothetical protein
VLLLLLLLLLLRLFFIDKEMGKEEDFIGLIVRDDHIIRIS